MTCNPDYNKRNMIKWCEHFQVVQLLYLDVQRQHQFFYTSQENDDFYNVRFIILISGYV